MKETQAQTVASEAGACENDKPCVGPICNKWDRIGEQCGVRSLGEAATILMEVFGPQILMAQGEPDEGAESDENPEEGDKST